MIQLAPGEFTRNIDPTGYPQIFIKSATHVLNHIGPWNDFRWNGAPTPLLTQEELLLFNLFSSIRRRFTIFSIALIIAQVYQE